jgi:ABC-type sugar transport system permease subunit/ABC-type glycerol-3-phosphate transport system substrate-binding protein
MTRAGVLAIVLAAAVLVGCAAEPAAPKRVTLVLSGSDVGAEGAVLERQVSRFRELNPEIDVLIRATPDAADQRHQLYVQWLNARAPAPDVLQLDVIWTPEFAAAGWIRPLAESEADLSDFFPATLEANRYRGKLYALPWFVDVGMLYYRKDLVPVAPRSFDELTRDALGALGKGGTRYGFVWQGARYEGLVTVFFEYLGGFGGRSLDDRGVVTVDSPAGVRALEFMRESIDRGVVPETALAWQEEQTRFAFQNGQAVFMRNWPYAAPLLADPEKSRVAGRFAVAPMPSASGGEPTAALGGAELAVNAHSRHPVDAEKLCAFLTAPKQMRERAELAGQLPARRSLFADDTLARALGAPPADLLRIVEHARPRPVTPLYSEISRALQIELHRALSHQEEPSAALAAAAREMNGALAGAERRPRGRLGPLVALLLVVGGLGIYWLRRARPPAALSDNRDARLGWTLVAPALALMAVVALFPLAWTAWEALFHDDLRMPWLGRHFVALDNFVEVAQSDHFWGALARTLAFVAISVSLELALGLALALALDRPFRGRGALRTVMLLPWAIPTVVVALVWRFLFDGQSAIAPFAWLAHPVAAWVPLILADVWKTTPFVALLLLAGLSTIDPRLDEAARIDGAGAWRRLVHVTLPLLRPAILVALSFRSLDAFRVFDLVYALTGGGPGTATEPIALYTFSTLLDDLRFGRGAALSVIVFAVAFGLALAYVRLLVRDHGEQQ